MARFDSGVRFDSGARFDEPEGNASRPRTSMIKISRFFKIIFSDPEISLNELIAFATDAQERMVANNPGALFNALITATATALTTLGNCFSDDITKLAFRKAAKQAKDTYRRALPGHINKIYGKVLGQYGDSAPQITQCFPAGRSIFQTEVDDALDDRLQALINGLAPLVPVMGPEAHADAGGLFSTWIALYAASESTTGAKSNTQEGKAAARAVLERQLMINLLTIAKQFVGEEDKANVYFQEHLLEDHPASEPEPPEPPVP